MPWRMVWDWTKLLWQSGVTATWSDSRWGLLVGLGTGLAMLGIIVFAFRHCIFG